jgi:hypothetical protein
MSYSSLSTYSSFYTIEHFNDTIELPQFVTCDIKGGLGNQLFMVFATMAYAKQNNKNVWFEYKNKYHGVTVRNSYWDNLFSSLSTMISNEPPIFFNTIYKEPFFNYSSIPNHYNKLEGYFQSEKYFKSYYPEIVEQLQFYRQRDKMIKELQLEKYTLRVSIHFRIGDYAKLESYHPIQKYDYYYKCLSYLMSNINSPIHLFCFYEETDFERVQPSIIELQKIFPSITIVHVPTFKLQDWQELILMSCCHHHIIANSSFSWWGAYINPYQTKIVCYPSVWFGSSLTNNTSDLCPPEWIKINS